MFRRLQRRYEAASALLPEIALRPAAALRDALREGYDRDHLRADVLAGLVVGVVALPLARALAIASGVPPQHGLYTAIVAGAAIAVLGGSRVQVSGPTAAFVVILAPISARFGLGGLCLATVMAGVMLIAMGAGGLGQLLKFVPYPVTTGFTAGIAVVIATIQVKDFLGLSIEHMPEHYVERMEALLHALPTFRAADCAIGALTMTALLTTPRFTKRVPAPLVALTLAAVANALAHAYLPSFEAATIGSRFTFDFAGDVRHGIPQVPPLPVWPWNLPGADGRAAIGINLALIRSLAPSAFAIAILGAIESLLSATVADGMAGTKHDPNAELFAQGVGNVLAPFFGGFAATGAIARTATNIRAGARSPIAAVVHALFVLTAVLALAPLVGYLPMAGLAALLMLVAWNMSEAKHFLHMVRVAPKSDVLVLLACFLLTVVFDMVISVTAGVMLAALMFMRRMADIADTRLVQERHPALHEPLPKQVVFYEIAGPLFFGAAQKAMSSLDAIAREARVVILDVENVPVMDATGLVALESALTRLKRHHVFVILAGVQAQPRVVLARGEIVEEAGILAIVADVHAAAAAANAHLLRAPSVPPVSPGGT